MESERRIHVRWDSKISDKIDNDDLKKFFGSFGEIAEFNRKSNAKKGPVPFCSLTFSSSSSADAALAFASPTLRIDGIKIQLCVSRQLDPGDVKAEREKRKLADKEERVLQERLEEEIAQKRRRAELECRSTEGGNVVFVSWDGADDAVDARRVRDHFAQYGVLVAVCRPWRRPDSSIPSFFRFEFLSPVDARTAILDGDVDVDGVVVRVGTHDPESDIAGAEIAGAEIAGADISGAEIAGARISGAEIAGARNNGEFFAWNPSQRFLRPRFRPPFFRGRLPLPWRPISVGGDFMSGRRWLTDLGHPPSHFQRPYLMGGPPFHPPPPPPPTRHVLSQASSNARVVHFGVGVPPLGHRPTAPPPRHPAPTPPPRCRDHPSESWVAARKKGWERQEDLSARRMGTLVVAPTNYFPFSL